MALESQDRLNWLLSCDSTGAKWLVQCYSLNLNFSFLNRISLLLISSSYSFDLMRLSGPHARPKVGIKFSDTARNRIRVAGMEGRDSTD